MIPNWRVPMIRGLLCGLMIVFLSHQAHSAKPITGEQIHQNAEREFVEAKATTSRPIDVCRNIGWPAIVGFGRIRRDLFA